MRPRSFLLASAAELLGSRKSPAQGLLGTLACVQADGLWIRELPDGRVAAEERTGSWLRNPASQA
jgi:hypothetical protein